jgi:hypothetical protein
MSTYRTSGWISLATVAAATTLWLGFSALTHAQTPEQRADRMPGHQMSDHGWKASDLIGQSVYTTGDQEKGKIKDLFISPNGRVEYAAVAFGGFVGIGEKMFAVPLDAIHLEWKDNKIERARVDVNEESIKQRQGFDDKHWPEQADRGFLTTAAPR